MIHHVNVRKMAEYFTENNLRFNKMAVEKIEQKIIIEN